VHGRVALEQLPYRVGCRSSSYDFGFPNPTGTDGVTFRLSARVLLDVPPTVTVTVPRRAHIRLVFDVDSSALGNLRVVLGDHEAAHTFGIRDGKRTLRLRFPKDITRGPKRLVLTPISPSGRFGKPIVRTVVVR
jgi:hypothetical protein